MERWWPYWGHLESFLKVFLGHLRRSGASWDHLGLFEAILGPCWAVWGLFGAIVGGLELSWAIFEAIYCPDEA